MMALEALSEYELKKSSRPEANVIAEFKVPGKQDRINLEMTNQKEKVETNLKVSESIFSITPEYTHKYLNSFLDYLFLVSFVPEIRREQCFGRVYRRRGCQAKSKFD